jgi:hypothetical protein
MNVVVTSYLLVCFYSVAGKKAKRQDFYTRRAPARTHCVVDRRDQTVTLQGGAATRWEIESFSRQRAQGRCFLDLRLPEA